MRISDWSSDVCSSDLRGAPKRGGSGDQAIAARLSDQDRGSRRIFLDLLAQAVDVGLQRVRGDAGIVAPDLAEQLLAADHGIARSEEHTSELQSLMRISYAVFCLKKKKTHRMNNCDRAAR